MGLTTLFVISLIASSYAISSVEQGFLSSSDDLELIEEADKTDMKEMKGDKKMEMGEKKEKKGKMGKMGKKAKKDDDEKEGPCDDLCLEGWCEAECKDKCEECNPKDGCPKECSEKCQTDCKECAMCHMAMESVKKGGHPCDPFCMEGKCEE